ncbi:LacI family transcriptional regulator [Butyricicoccus sp. AM29-23AC]|nr:LacI family transcriptional regulator [Butyricicoccus sp. AM29-23AC]
MDTPTIYDVSRLSGVSTATVSRTFTAPDRVREETRRKVLAAAEALGYQPARSRGPWRGSRPTRSRSSSAKRTRPSSTSSMRASAKA